MEERLLGTIYKDGDTIVDEGAESKEMYILQSGKVNVTTNPYNEHKSCLFTSTFIDIRISFPAYASGGPRHVPARRRSSHKPGLSTIKFRGEWL